MNISVLNFTDYKIDMRIYKYFLKASLHTANITGDVNLVFVDDKYITELNKKYRNKNKATDVLTFSMDEEGEGGEIVISYEWVLNHYELDKVRKNVYELIIHSVLHLKGIDHNYTKASLLDNRKKMKSLYKRVVEYIKIQRNKKII